MKKPGLGRGLDALIPQVPAPGGSSVQEIGVDAIAPNPFQPRRQFDDASLQELAASIRQHGVVQPIVVRANDDGYELVAGERRLRAARIAGLDTVPAIVRMASDAQMLQVALIENLQREDINAIDAAGAYQQLMTQFNATQEEVAHEVGKSRAAVANTLRLLRLPGSIQQAVRESALSEGHARALLALPSEAEMHIVWRKIEAHGLSVRDTETLVKRVGDRQPGQPREEPTDRDANVTDLEQRLQRALGTRVEIKTKRKGGTIAIQFTSPDDLGRLIEILESSGGSVVGPAITGPDAE